MNEHLRDRVLRKLETLSDERGYQVLDYVEFLESKYGQRQAAPQSVFARFSEAVEDRLRAGKISASAIAETMSLMNRAMNVLNGVATGVAAASRSVASDFATGASRSSGQSAARTAGTGSGASAGVGGAPVAGSGPGTSTAPAPSVDPADSREPHSDDERRADIDELDPPLGR